MGGDAKVGGTIRYYLLDAAIGNRPKFLHSPLKIGVSVAQSKCRCNSGTTHAKCGRTCSLSSSCSPWSGTGRQYHKLTPNDRRDREPEAISTACPAPRRRPSRPL